MDSQNTQSQEKKQLETANRSSVYLKALALMGITTSYIFVPMVVITGGGWWLSQRFEQQWIVFVAAFISLIISNLLIFKNTEKVLKRILG